MNQLIRADVEVDMSSLSSAFNTIIGQHKPPSLESLRDSQGDIRRNASIMIGQRWNSGLQTVLLASDISTEMLEAHLRYFLDSVMNVGQPSQDHANHLRTCLEFCKSTGLDVGMTFAVITHVCTFNSWIYDVIPGLRGQEYPFDGSRTAESLKSISEYFDGERSRYIGREEFEGVWEAGDYIIHPYTIYPRRLWDLYTNRVIPTCWIHAGHRLIRFYAITHSWILADQREEVISPINCYAWPIPLPKGVSLSMIRENILDQFPGLRYCWLDVLCLRQQGFSKDACVPRVPLGDILGLYQERGDSIRRINEWKIDVPTIGNIYQLATSKIRYFNGLGIPVSTKGWDAPTHWLNRAWTLQEGTGTVGDISCVVKSSAQLELTNVKTGSATQQPLNLWGSRGGEYKYLRDFVQEVDSVLQNTSGNRDILALAREMGNRYASTEIDKIAGLSYLLGFEVLPTYDAGLSEHQAWERCLRYMPYPIKLSLFFDCPLVSESNWFPTWDYITCCPILCVPSPPTVIPEHIKLQSRNKNNRGHHPFPGLTVTGYVFYDCTLMDMDKQDDGKLDDGSHEDTSNSRGLSHYSVTYGPAQVTWSFFCPYYRSHVNIPNGNYTLISLDLNPCSSWVVLKGSRKVGILRSDEFFHQYIIPGAVSTLHVD